jgi:hypothetical protein
VSFLEEELPEFYAEKSLSDLPTENRAEMSSLIQREEHFLR